MVDLERTSADIGPPAPDFEEFYGAHFQSLTIQLYAYAGDLADAQDVVQEAFCRALDRWPRVSRLDDPGAWIRHVAWNLATSQWRRATTAARFARRHRDEPVPSPGPDRVDLAAALAGLPARHRRAVILHYLADMPISEIAAQEKTTEGTVKSWLHRGRAALAARLTDEENPHG